MVINNEGTDISFVSKLVGPIKDGTPMVFSFVTMLIGPIKDSTPMKEADSVRKIGPVREIVEFLDLPQEGVGVGDRHDMQTFRLPD